MKLLTVIGARPQFIKAASVSRAIRLHNEQAESETSRTRIDEVILHTGQHFDKNMSDVFFSQLDIPQPNHNLGIASLGHGAMTGRMLENIEDLLKQHHPDAVMVYGDTNSTLAAALAAVKLHIPVVHVEAGLRSHNPYMPEEINRVLTDRISTLLLCPTEAAIINLRDEGYPFAAIDGVRQRIENVGDVMYDAVLFYREIAQERIKLETWFLQDKGYVLCTLHRQENTDNFERLKSILDSLEKIAEDFSVVLPLHPRTSQQISIMNLQSKLKKIKTIEPLPYLEMQRLQMSARCIITDSGGIQKEAYFHNVPCITLRTETEWMETVDAGANILAGCSYNSILNAFQKFHFPVASDLKSLYGDGNAANNIISAICDMYEQK